MLGPQHGMRKPKGQPGGSPLHSTIPSNQQGAIWVNMLELKYGMV